MEALVFIVASVGLTFAVGLWAVILHQQRVIDLQANAEEEARLLKSLMTAISDAKNLESALKVTLAKVCDTTGWVYGEVWVPSDGGRRLGCSPVWHATIPEIDRFHEASAGLTYEPGQGLPGRAWASKRPEWVADAATNVTSQRAELTAVTGLHGGLAIPVLSGEDAVAVLVFFVKKKRPEDERLMRLISAVAAGLGAVIRRRQMEEALARSEERYRTLFNSANDAIFMYHLRDDGSPEPFEEVNDFACALVGYTREELRRMTRRDLMASELVQASGEIADRLRRQGHVVFDHVLTAKGGRRIPVEISAHLFVFAGRATVLSMIRDVTGRKTAEEALQAANRALEKTLRELQTAQERVVLQERLSAVGQMATGIAHDFNNALTSILGYSELLLAHPDRMGDAARVAEHVKLINTSAKDAANVVRGLREFCRVRGEGEVFAPVRVGEVVEQAVALTRPRWKDEAQARGRRIAVEVDVPPDVPAVAGNASELRELLTNVIFNAVDALPNGGTIAIAARGEQDFVALAVRDDGTGMTEEVRRRCLEPFFSTKGERGTGMGLAMAYGIVRRHDGAIDVESAPGRGTTFTIRLPVRARAKGPAGATGTAVLHRKLHVLLVEDERAVRDVVREFLLDDGHTVVTAVNGRDGLEKFASDRFDLVITDRAMPEMGGDEMAAAIRRRSPSRPVLMLTGFGDIMDAEGEKPEGVNLVVGKPVTPEGLREAIRRVLGA